MICFRKFKNVIDNSPKLKVIGCYCIGTNQVDLEYCRSKGIAVINSPYMNTRSVAELTISEIIALSRKLGDKNNELHNGTWNKSHINCYEIRGKVLGIIGYGHVGSQLSILAQNIGMTVIYYDILNHGKSKSGFNNLSFELFSEQLLNLIQNLSILSPLSVIILLIPTHLAQMIQEYQIGNTI